MRYLSLILFPATCEGPSLSPSIAQTPFTPDSGDIAVRCGALIDGLSDRATTDRLVIIRDGRFERITSGDASAADDIPIPDLSEHTCLPGLINAYVHLMDLPDVGAIEAGRFGDLITIRSNPLSDMSVMKNVDVAIKGGLVFKNQSCSDGAEQTGH